MKALTIFATTLALFVGGCAEDRYIGRPNVTLIEQKSLPAPIPTDLVAAPAPQVLGPADQVSVDVFGLPEFSRTVTIDRSGHISLPLVGEVEASGKTPSQLGQTVTGLLRTHYVRDPQVSINVTQVVSQVLTVEGEVRAPGLYPVTGHMTLMRAIARAQGTTDVARTNYILVYRRVGDHEYAGLYDLRAIQLGMYPDPEIFANDIVVVDESRARRTFSLLVATSGVLVAPLIAVLNRI